MTSVALLITLFAGNHVTKVLPNNKAISAGEFFWQTQSLGYMKFKATELQLANKTSYEVTSSMSSVLLSSNQYQADQ